MTKTATTTLGATKTMSVEVFMYAKNVVRLCASFSLSLAAAVAAFSIYILSNRNQAMVCRLCAVCACACARVCDRFPATPLHFSHSHIRHADMDLDMGHIAVLVGAYCLYCFIHKPIGHTRGAGNGKKEEKMKILRRC